MNRAYTIIIVGIAIMLVFAALGTLPGNCYTRLGGGNPCIARYSSAPIYCRVAIPPINYTTGSVSISVIPFKPLENYTPGVGYNASGAIRNLSVAFVNGTDNTSVSNAIFSSPNAGFIPLIANESHYNVTLQHVLPPNSCEDVHVQLWIRYTYNGTTTSSEFALLFLFSGRQSYLNEWFGGANF